MADITLPTAKEVQNEFTEFSKVIMDIIERIKPIATLKNEYTKLYNDYAQFTTAYQYMIAGLEIEEGIEKKAQIVIKDIQEIANASGSLVRHATLESMTAALDKITKNYAKMRAERENLMNYTEKYEPTVSEKLGEAHRIMRFGLVGLNTTIARLINEHGNEIPDIQLIIKDAEKIKNLSGVLMQTLNVEEKYEQVANELIIKLNRIHKNE